MLTSRFPGEVSGADLPTLTNPAGAGDMAAGKQAIGQDGGVGGDGHRDDGGDHYKVGGGDHYPR